MPLPQNNNTSSLANAKLKYFLIYYFQVSSSEFGNLQSIELLPNGENISVTNSNREQFVALYVNHLLVKSVERQFEAFSRGFHKVSVNIQGEILWKLLLGFISFH